MTNVQYLLTCLMEECAEVAQRCSKAIRFGLDEVHLEDGNTLTNERRIVDEICDLRGVVSELQNYGVFMDLNIPGYVNDRRQAKINKLRAFMKYSRDRGILAPMVNCEGD